MDRRPPLVLVTLVALAIAPPAARAAGGGAGPSGSAAQGPAAADGGAPSGGSGAPPATAPGPTGAARPHAVARRPTLRRFSLSPLRLTAGSLPQVALRIDQRGVPAVRVRVELVRSGRSRPAISLSVAEVPTGRTIELPWPTGAKLAPGRYLARLHVVSPGGARLRSSGRDRRAQIVVRAAPRPAPAPQPPPPTPSPAPGPISSDGVFPVAGPHTYGQGFGAPRSGYSHQGQDLLAAEGTPVLAPRGGTISARANQPSAAGFYVTLDADDGYSYFFAHCQKDSWAVTLGQVVSAGQQLCRVGQTGDASGPHLHFEQWTGGWRRGKNSAPVDPLAQLQLWDR